MRILITVLVYVSAFLPRVHVLSFGKVGGLFPIHSRNNGACGEINMAAVQEMEAVNWIFDKLNKVEYIKGVSIELLPHDTCGLTDKALRAANVFAQESDQETCLDQPRQDIFSIIGPRSDEGTIAVSRLISSVPEKQQMAQLSYASSSSKQVNRSLHRNVFRILPTYTTEMKALVALLEELEWTYIAIIQVETEASKAKIEVLKQLSTTHGICVVETLSVSTIQPELTTRSKLLRDLRNIVNTNGVSGFVLLDWNGLSDLFLSVTESDESLRNIMAVIVEDPNHLVAPPANPTILGLFKVRLYEWDIEEFQTYWQDMFTRISFVSKESPTNESLISLYKMVTNCTNDIVTECPRMTANNVKNTMPLSPLVSYAIQAALVMARALHVLHENKCGNYRGACSDLRSSSKEELISILDKLSYDFKDDSNVVPKRFHEQQLHIGFDENGEVVLPDRIHSYEILNFRRCKGTDVGFCFVKIGNYSATNGRLQLNKQLIRQFSGDDDVLWDKMKKAQCPHNMICSQCLKTSKDKHIYTRRGDLYIVAIVPIHSRGKDMETCGEMRMAGGFEVSESIAYAIDLAKEQHLAVPSVDIGLIVIDSCDSDMLITERILTLHTHGLLTDDGNYTDVSDKIIGYIGGLGSGVSIASAEILRSLGVIQISYGSTSALLSNRNQFPYFLRVTTSDDLQASALLKIVQKLNVNYVQLVYSRGAYGEGGMHALKKHAEKLKICIAQSIAIDEGDNDIYEAAIEKIKLDSNAKVVIVFLRSHIAAEFLEVVNNEIIPGQYILIGSEGWAIKDYAVDLINLEGAITLSSLLPHYVGFLSKMGDLSSESDPDNPWLHPYISSQLRCYYQKSFNKTAGRVCGENERLDSHINYKVDTWTPFSIIATHALLRGVHDTLQDLCGNIKSLCELYRKRPEDLVRNIKKVKLDLENQQQLTEVFDENGDGILGYKIWNLQKDEQDPQKLKYKQVGWTTADGHIDIEASQLVSPGEISFSLFCDENTCPECFPVRLNESVSADCISSQVIYITFSVFGVVAGILVSVIVCIMMKPKKKQQIKEAPSIVVLRETTNNKPTLEEIYEEIGIDHGDDVRYHSIPGTNQNAALRGTIKDGYLIPDSDDNSVASISLRNKQSSNSLQHQNRKLSVSTISNKTTKDVSNTTNPSLYACIPDIPSPVATSEYIEMNTLPD